jgi:hypothetical protein
MSLGHLKSQQCGPLKKKFAHLWMLTVFTIKAKCIRCNRVHTESEPNFSWTFKDFLTWIARAFQGLKKISQQIFSDCKLWTTHTNADIIFEYYNAFYFYYHLLHVVITSIHCDGWLNFFVLLKIYILFFSFKDFQGLSNQFKGFSRPYFLF